MLRVRHRHRVPDHINERPAVVVRLRLVGPLPALAEPMEPT
jgi:hypothetical protein